ncbi:MAG: lipoyl(octanoyl) transferase LipB [Bryobacterales bacterium]|nr:lipoyl(octanoyl) transferase LipB [Bryobacterales bacterium]
MPRLCEFRDAGLTGYAEGLALQRRLVAGRKAGAIPDQLVFTEHRPVITQGRNAKDANLLASPEILTRAGIELHATDRGGDVTFHGPGQLVGYPILDLKDWKRDVVAYVRALEEVLIAALGEFGLPGERAAGMTGVWVRGAKVAAIGVHLSRWVTSHGFALNVDTDLSYFRYIVPCGLTLPVASLRSLGCQASRAGVSGAVRNHFERVFDCRLAEPVEPQQLERIA